MALSHAHTLFLMATQPPDSLQALVSEGAALRELLLADATALARRGLVDGSRMRDMRGPNGYKNLAVDSQIMAALFRDSFANIQGKSATTLEEVQNADRIAAGILRSVRLKEQGTMSIASTADMRVRAFNAFTRAYDQARRAVLFLRWSENDVDKIAPSLYAGRGGCKKEGSDITAPPASASGSGAPTDAPGAPTGPGAPSTPVDGTSAPGSKPATGGPEMYPRQTLSLLRGPMTRSELRMALEQHAGRRIVPERGTGDQNAGGHDRVGGHERERRAGGRGCGCGCGCG